MNAPLPAMPPRADEDEDIDTRVMRAEQRLIAREQRLRQGVADLTGQLRHSLRPRRLLLPGGVLLGAVTLVSLLRRRPAAAHAAPPPPRAPLPHIPWPRLFDLAWPMLPQRWRDRVSPAMASNIAALMPLAEGLFGRAREAVPLKSMPEVDLVRLAGRWFVVGELPGPQQPEAQQPPELGLLPRDDGQVELLQLRVDAAGSTHAGDTLLQPVPGSHGARLRSSRWPEALQWLPGACSEHVVLHVDAAYEEALIGTAERDSLWLLSRRPALPAERRQALVQKASDQGFPVRKLRLYTPA